MISSDYKSKDILKKEIFDLIQFLVFRAWKDQSITGIQIRWVWRQAQLLYSPKLSCVTRNVRSRIVLHDNHILSPHAHRIALLSLLKWWLLSFRIHLLQHAHFPLGGIHDCWVCVHPKGRVSNHFSSARMKFGSFEWTLSLSLKIQ